MTPAFPQSGPGSGPRGRLLLWAVLALALLLRLAHWWAVRDQPFFAWLAMDSQEYDRWAQEIAAGDWLGSQVFFQAPLYPYFLAVLYKLFGRSLDAVYLVQIGLAVAGCYALYRAGREMGGERLGLAAAGLAAVYGPFLFYDVQVLKESLAVTVTAFLLWALAAGRAEGALSRASARGRVGEGAFVDAGATPSPTLPRFAGEGATSPGGTLQGERWAWWLGAGVWLGILALLRENALLLLPFLLPLAWRRAGGGGGLRSFAKRGAALALGLVLPLVPVALRNGWVSGDFLPTTFQGGVNFYIGNNPEADGTYRPIVPGKQIPALERREPVRVAEQELGRKLSPAEVSRFWLDRSLSWAAAHPGDFLRLQVRKLGMFWSWYEWPDAVDYYFVRLLSPVYRLPLLELGGVVILAAAGLWALRRRPGPFAPALLWILAWMLSTVVFFLFARYRLPALPALLLIAAVPVSRLPDLWRESRRRRFAAFGLILAALFLPRLAGYQPRMDLVHYNLARLEEERGHTAAAHEHYHAAFVLNPRDFLACLNLGNLAARQGDWATALRFYTRAAAIEPASDDAQSNLGGVYLALGRIQEAEHHLDRALELNAQNRTALHNKALLLARRGDLAGARELNRRLLEIDPENPAALRLRGRLGG